MLSPKKGCFGSQSSRPDFAELSRLLVKAAEENDTEEIEMLAEEGVDLSAPSGSGGLSALHRAALTGSLDVLRMLLKAGVEVDAIELDGRRTAIHFAVLRSDATAVKALVAAGASMDAQDSDGRTPLHLACIVSPDAAIPLCLLDAGADVSMTDACGASALDIAVQCQRATVVSAIFNGENRRNPPRPSPANVSLLYSAVRRGNASIVNSLVGAGWEADVPVIPPQSESREPSKTAGEMPVTSFPVAGTRSALSHTALAKAPLPAVPEVSETLSPLMLAADSGCPDVVKALLRGRHKGFPNSGDSRGYTALHFAAMRGSTIIVEYLLGMAPLTRAEGDWKESGGNDGGGGNGSSDGSDPPQKLPTFADPDVVNADGDTALHIAVATRRIDVGEVLLRARASVRIANRFGHTALHFAAALGLWSFAKALLENGADVAAVDGALSATPRPHDKTSPGTRMNGTAKVKTVVKPVTASPSPKENRRSKRLRTNDDVGTKDSAAAASPAPSMATRSSKQKSSPGPSSRNNCTSKSSRLTSTKKSVSGGGGGGGGGKDCKKEGRTPLHYATMNGHIETTRVLLDAGAPPAHRLNEERESPLFAAAINGHSAVVALLLERLGPEDVDMPVSAGETPLSAACVNGHVDVVEKLLRKGADVSHRNPISHQSILDVAVSIASPITRTRIVKTLLEAKADPNGGEGTEALSTPLHAACRGDSEGGFGAVSALLDGGADANAAPPSRGRRLLRPLHIAAVHGNVEAVSALTLNGCRLDVKTLDPSRSTPLVLAVQQGHVDAARALIKAGAAIDVVPRREDGSERAPSLTRLAAKMNRGDMVSLLVRGLIERDSSETWTKLWAASTRPDGSGSGDTTGVNGAAGGDEAASDEDQADGDGAAGDDAAAAGDDAAAAGDDAAAAGDDAAAAGDGAGEDGVVVGDDDGDADGGAKPRSDDVDLSGQELEAEQV